MTTAMRKVLLVVAVGAAVPQALNSKMIKIPRNNKLLPFIFFLLVSIWLVFSVDENAFWVRSGTAGFPGAGSGGHSSVFHLLLGLGFSSPHVQRVCSKQQAGGPG